MVESLQLTRELNQLMIKPLLDLLVGQGRGLPGRHLFDVVSHGGMLMDDL